MTVLSENKKNQYTCDEEQVVFPYTFLILDAAHLLVVYRDAEGEETILTLNAETDGYTVDGVGEATGGNVTTTEIYPALTTLTITRDVPVTQETDYIENDIFPADSHERALDKLTMIVQQMIELLGRQLSLSASSIHKDLVLPDPVAQKLLQWKDDLSGLVNVSLYDLGLLGVTDFAKTLLNDENATAVLATLEHTKALHDSLGLSHDSLADVSTDDHHARYTDGEVGTVADALIATHALLPSIHHLRYTDAEAEAAAAALIATHADIATAHQDAPALILTHKNIATAHQDAPALILTHKGDENAHHAQAHTLASHSTKAHAELTDVGTNQHHNKLHGEEHETGGDDEVDHDALVGFVGAEHKSLPNTLAEVLSDHNKAAHDALALDHGSLSGKDDDDHSQYYNAARHTKAVHDALGLSHDSLVDVSVDDHHAQVHTLASHSTKPHSALTDVTIDQHHARDHAATHGPAAADALKLDDLAVPDDNVDLNASTAKHGLLKKLSNIATQFLNGQGNWVTGLYPSPISIPPAAFMPRYDTYDWTLDQESLKHRVALTAQYFYAPAILPHGVTVSRIDLFGYRDAADAVLSLYLFRIDRVGGQVAMATIIADWTTGYSSGYDDSIGNPVIDNDNYAYVLNLRLDPDAAVAEVIFTGAKITFS